MPLRQQSQGLDSDLVPLLISLRVRVHGIVVLGEMGGTQTNGPGSSFARGVPWAQICVSAEPSPYIRT